MLWATFDLMIVLLTSWSNFTETYYCNFWSHEKHKFLSISWLKLLSISCFDLMKFDLLNPCPCCWYIMKKYCIRELWIRIQHILEQYITIQHIKYPYHYTMYYIMMYHNTTMFCRILYHNMKEDDTTKNAASIQHISQYNALCNDVS
jgi:hypothetical protein